MPAIITDQFRILNADTFVQSFTGIGTTTNYYYTFLAHPDPEGLQSELVNYGTSNWNTETPEPLDSFEQETSYHDSMLFLKRITGDDVRRIVTRYNWQSGSTYDMYRHDYDINTPAPSFNAKTLYEGKYVVVNSEYKVYLCIHNGSEPENPNGRKSQVEPNFVSTTPQKASVSASDGYLWKYLFTISPADVVKFATDKYVPLPKIWGDVNTEAVKSASVNGRLESIIIDNRGANYALSEGSTLRIPVWGDGTGGEATVTIANGEIASAEITSPGKDYTRAHIKVSVGIQSGLNVDSSGNYIQITGGTGAQFIVPCPPKGGHGHDIYRECGSNKVMVYSKYDADPDYVTGNSFSRIGIIKNPTVNGSKTEPLNTSTATALGALKMYDPTSGSYPANGEISQNVGVGSTAIGYVASYNNVTGVLRYFQPTGISEKSNSGYKVLPFSNSAAAGVSTTINISGVGTSRDIDRNYTDKKITIGGKVIEFGQDFTSGIAPPDIEKYSGEIVYIDNRAPITRSASQKEELKIVVEF